MSPHPMVKDTTKASSDPQGPGHVSSNSKDEVSASSDPQGLGHASSNSKDKISISSDPQGPGHASSNSGDEVSASSDPKAWAATCPVPREGLRLVQPPWVDFCLTRSLGDIFGTGLK